MFGFTAGSLPYIRNGQMRPLAVTSAARIPELPEVPTMAEAGAAGAEVDVWYGVLAPTGTPPAIVQRLNTEISTAVQELTPRFAELGAYPLRSTPGEYQAFIRSEVVRWREIVRRSDAHVD
jgi:tripartite-type tricarboxylate transporter receptor subunit TctC